MATAGLDGLRSPTADFPADATVTAHVTGKALRPTLLTMDVHARSVRITLTGTSTGRVALAVVQVHP